MKSWIRYSIVGVCILLLSTTVAVQPAHAVLIRVIEGQFEGFDPPMGSGPVFTLSKGVVTAPFILSMSGLNNLVVDVTNFTSALAEVELNKPTEQVSIFGVGGGMAVFALFNPGTLSPVPVTGLGKITSEVTLLSNDLTDIELGPVGTRFSFIVDVFCVEVLPGNPPGNAGSARWPLEDCIITGKFELSSIPEPASLTMAVIGLVSLAGMGWCRRKRKRAA